MAEVTERCEACGSWDRACSSPTPVPGCGCNRCLRATNDKLKARVEAWTRLYVAVERHTSGHCNCDGRAGLCYDAVRSIVREGLS